MTNTNKFSLKKRIQSFSFAFNGIKNLIIKEHNARVHIVAIVCVIGLGLYFNLKVTEWIVICIAAGLVFISEIFNTAIERLADIVEPKINQKIGLIKDYCAGAVLISAIISLIVGGFIFIPKITDLIKTFY